MHAWTRLAFGIVRRSTIRDPGSAANGAIRMRFAGFPSD